VGLQAGAPSGQTAFEQKLALAHRALLDTKGLQLQFTSVQPPPRPPWLDALARFLEAAAPVARVLFWAVLALGVLLIVVFIVRELSASRRRAREIPAPVDWRPDAEAARALLEDADRLAEAGRFDEAMHLLLFRSIEDLSTRRPGVVRPALTSRDIAGLAIIPADPREAFRRIAEAVERSFFGGRPARREDFARCRADYETFAFAGEWA
jgi:hypothetical protein